MVRGLLLRQGLTGINLILAAAIGYIIYLVGMEHFGPKPAQRNVAELLENSSASDVAFQGVGPRGEYDSIVNGKLFGQAGAESTTVETAAVAEPPVVQTTAPLKLLATVASYPGDKRATAIIENPTATTPNKVSTYYQGQQVMPNLVLAEVHRRRVYLMNTAKNQKEELVMTSDSTESGLGKAPGLNRGVARMDRDVEKDKGHITLERQEVEQELSSTNTADLLADLNPEYVRDEKGNVTGITSASLSSLPLAQRVGLQDHDVIQSVNGMNIDNDDPARLGEIAQRVGNSNTVRLSILRDGKPQMITVKLQ